MKKKALWKDITKEIWKSKSRFFSIFALILLGVAFFIGIKATGPDMLKTADHYYKANHLADYTVQSNYGIDDSDLEELRQADQVETVEPGYTADLLLKGDPLAFKLYSYDTKDGNRVNQFVVKSGRLPKKSGEIALDDTKEMHEKFKIGDTVSFVDKNGDAPEDTLKNNTFKVVGFVSSPQYIEQEERGTSTVGKGQTDAIAVVPEKDFDMDVYTVANILFKNTSDLESYSDEYEDTVKEDKKAIDAALKDQPEKRLDEIKQDGEQEITENEAKLNDAKKQLADGEKQLNDAKSQLDQGWADYESGKKTFDQKIADGQAELDQAESQLASAKTELDQAKPALESGRTQLDDAKQQLADGESALSEAESQLSALGTAVSGAQTYANFLSQLSSYPTIVVDANQSEDFRYQDGEIHVSPAFKTELYQIASQSSGGTAALDALFAGQVSQASLAEMQTKASQTAASLNAQYQTAQNEFNAKKAELDAASNELAQKETELTQAEAKYQSGEKAYTDGMAQLATGKAELATAQKNGQAELDTAYAKLEESQQAYDENAAKFADTKAESETKIADGEKQLTEAQEQLDQLEKPKYYVLDRSNNPGYSEFKENADRLNSMSTVFPVFFFLIAGLVCLTTMTRMVEEQRTQIGTLKALGYDNRDIMLKFLVYGTTASVLGTIGGIFIGHLLFPQIIYNAYNNTMYSLPPVDVSYYLSFSIISLIVALICTTLTAYVACRAELRANAATLMRPKAPKNGKRILLERMPFIWKRMSFTYKVTARNIFRYKQRMLMTVLGVAGCTALILTGFGLRDSISDIAKLQYGNVMKYDAMVAKDVNATKSPKQDYEKLMQDPNITERLQMSLASFDTKKEGENTQQVSVAVPESTKHFSDFISLHNRKTGEKEQLGDNGAVVTEKLAKLYDLKPGDTITIKDASNDTYQVKISAIAENYAGHYLFMSKDYYQKVFHEKPSYNTDLLNFDNTSSKWQDHFAEQLTKNSSVLSVTFSNSISDMLNESLSSLNVVMLVLVISAAILAFIVLYNLTNINVSERIRELSTIKVLGFYPKEVTMYVYRENIILTFLGILVGFVLGFFLHRFVITTAEVDNMMFSPGIYPVSYLYAAILTFVFATIVMLVMHVRLKRIDMIEALKSVE
ncbi:FtsX-like permease family protein [Listeria costaricensis]|uniref:FtsX-like permease family protein n=1 Tax=Listeria costaricensis TaxID=2026604 RepID=UPI001968DEAE|nr:FtsX-like permease family protein [Listeria costaricensis]